MMKNCCMCSSSFNKKKIRIKRKSKMCGIDSFPSFNNIDKLHEIKINLMNNLKM